MNVQLKWCAAVLLGSVMAVGCGDDADDNTAPATPPPGSTPAAPQASGTDTSDTTTGLQGTVDTTKADAQQASDRLKAGAQTAADDASAAASNLTAEQANTQIQQVMTYINENKLDLAETALQQLEKNKTSLPTAVQPQVDQARQALNAAKAKGTSGATPAAPAQPATPAPAPAP